LILFAISSTASNTVGGHDQDIHGAFPKRLRQAVKQSDVAARFEDQKMALHRLRKMKMEKKRSSTKRRMMHATPDSGFLCEALFSE
jgi:hypothetical protein